MLRYNRSVWAAVISLLGLVLASSAVVATAAGVGSPVIIATGGDAQTPQVAYSQHITHAVWAEAGWLMYSQNTGVTWTAPVSITVGDEPALVVDYTGTPHLAFTAFVNATYNIYHTRYAAGGWSAPVRVSIGTADAVAPDIAAAPDNSLGLVWSEGGARQIQFAQSTVGGLSWPTLAPIPDANGNAPRLAIGGDNVPHVIWQDDAVAPFRIKHRQRAAGVWSLTAILSDETNSAFAPDLVAAGGQAHLVWQQASTIRYTQGTGVAFSAPITLSTGTATAPAIGPGPLGGIAVAWDAGVTMTLRVQDALGWGSPIELGVNPAGVSRVALAAGPADHLYAVFSWGTAGSRDVAFNEYTITSRKTYLPLIRR